MLLRNILWSSCFTSEEAQASVRTPVILVRLKPLLKTFRMTVSKGWIAHKVAKRLMLQLLPEVWANLVLLRVKGLWLIIRKLFYAGDTVIHKVIGSPLMVLQGKFLRESSDPSSGYRVQRRSNILSWADEYAVLKVRTNATMDWMRHVLERWVP